MDNHSAQLGVTPLGWLQHHLPWLGLLALVMGLFRDGADSDVGFDPDDLNG